MRTPYILIYIHSFADKPQFMHPRIVHVRVVHVHVTELHVDLRRSRFVVLCAHLYMYQKSSHTNNVRALLQELTSEIGNRRTQLS